MITINVNSFHVTGLVVRTSNADEMNASTAKIGKLWEAFYKAASLKLTPNSKIYGLYTNYESDVTGKFDVIACSDTLSTSELENARDFHIPSGKYLKFSGTGEMPKTVIAVWGQIWDYFNADSCPHVRAYTTDFEFYKSNDEIEIYVSIS